MRQFGLIGFPLSHSFSVDFFTKKFREENILDCTYQNFPLENINDFRSLIAQHPELRGLNVTIPHKENVILLLDEIDHVASDVGAVNCIRISGDGKTMGYNTDVYGFRISIQPFLENRFERALILGTGGASKAVEYVLNQLGISVSFVTRKPTNSDHIGYHDLLPEVIPHFRLIINTTPLGTFPDVKTCPDIPYDALTRDHLLFDLVYNPPETLFMKKGKEKGAAVMNGSQMLIHQALKSWEIWNSRGA